MKVIKYFAISLLLITALNVNNANANNVGVLDVSEILKNSTVMKDIRKQIDKKQTEFQKDIDTRQSKLEMESKKLGSKKSVLSPHSFEKQQLKLQEKVSDLKYYVEQKQKSLQKSSADAVVYVNNRINKIILKISKEKGLSLIIPSNQTLFYVEEIDISSLVLKELNKTLTTVEVKFEE